jgi:hypothetical protein
MSLTVNGINMNRHIGGGGNSGGGVGGGVGTGTIYETRETDGLQLLLCT